MKKLALLGLALMSEPLLAHPGPSHSHFEASSGTVVLLVVLSIAVASFIVAALRTKLRTK